MENSYRHTYPTLGVLAGWQYYWTATSLSYLDPIYRGIRQAARDLNCNLLLGCGMGLSAAANDPLRPAWPLAADESDFVPIGPWNTDGLIVVNPLHAPARSRHVQAMIAAGHPLIFVGAGEPGPTIVADNAGGITQALHHLVQHGHRRIAFIAGSRDDMEGDTGDRLRAYRAGVTDYGLAADERLVAFGRHVFAGGRAAMQQILAAGAAFTAVLASNDESALGAIQVLQESGRRVPDDVAIIGFDDRPESAVRQPALTSVHVPLFKMGYQAVEHLLRQMQGQPAASQPIRVSTRLAVRASCGCGRNPIVAEAAKAEASPAHVARRMARAVLVELQSLGEDEIETLCRDLIADFMNCTRADRPDDFAQAIAPILARAATVRDDSHGWQAAISILRDELPQLLAAATPDALGRGYAALDQARMTISAAMRLQHRQAVVDRRQMGDRVGLLTARLLSALDENQVYEILAQHLPEMGIGAAWVALFEAQGDDPVAWSHLRAVTAPGHPRLRMRSREFPPAAWLAADQPFSLALAPLQALRSGAGFVAFEAVRLELLGAIAQQMSGALNTAQLYRDATEGRRLAEEANRLKSRFLSTVSHELRTPLNIIVGMSGLLRQESSRPDLQLPEQVRQDIDRIHANAQHLGRLIGDVLDLASSDAGQLRLTHDFVDLGQVMRQAAETGRRLTEAKGLAWREALPESGPWVWGDRTRLQQVALNLISNAVKFTARGEVGIHVAVGADAVTVSVHDTGLGLPLAEQPAIFDDFQRSERSIARGYSGIGLGLAVCKRLIALHEGVIGVRSGGEEGGGSVFYFTLPTVAVPAQTPPPPPAQTLPALPQVLVLAARPVSRRLQEHLQSRGFDVRVLPITDATAWLTQLLSGRFSAVVLDISEAAEHGWQALKLLKSNPATQNIPALFYAASADSGLVLELDYLTKPIEIAELTRALDQRWLATEEVGHARTFLVVDDDPHTLDLHTRIIQAQLPTNRVLRARNGAEALARLQQAPVDLVLLDLMMPELDGFGVLEAMRADPRTRDIPVIVITGQTLTETEMARLSHGVATVMSKGLFDLDETLARLEAALKHKQKLSNEAQRTMRKAMAYIHQHYAEPLSRHALAHHVGLSDDYLTYCFRQELGMTPILYLNRYRIAQAKTRLLSTDMSITAIALEVGFSTGGYFSRLFRRETGLSPEAFRRQGAA